MTPIEVFEQLARKWETTLREKRHSDAALNAFLGSLLFREMNEQALQSASLTHAEKAIQQLQKDLLGQNSIAINSERICSFCNKAEPEVRLAAGPTAFICNECVKKLNTFFDKG